MKARLLEGGHHDRQRLGGPVLPLTKPVNGVAAGGVAGQQEAPQSLDGDDISFF